MNEWVITIERWPHSTGAGGDVDQEYAGPRVSTFIVYATDFDDAQKQARLLSKGMCDHPRCWQAPITSIVKAKIAH